MTAFSESVVEEADLAWIEATRWQVAHRPTISPDIPVAERAGLGEAALTQRLQDVLLPKLNSGELQVNDAEKFIERSTA